MTVRKFLSNSKTAIQARLARTKKLGQEIKSLPTFSDSKKITVRASHLFDKNCTTTQVVSALNEAAKETDALDRILQCFEADNNEQRKNVPKNAIELIESGKGFDYVITCSVPNHGKVVEQISADKLPAGLSMTTHEFELTHLGLVFKYSTAKGSVKITEPRV